MTDILQPTDLAVDSMVKAFMRKQRIKMAANYFQRFQAECYAALATDLPSPYPQLNPPSPRLMDPRNLSD